MMKKYCKYIAGLLVLSVSLLSSCKDDNELGSGFSIDKDEIAIGENGGVETIQVNGNVKWQTTVDGTWVKVLPSSGNGSTLCEIKVDSSVVADFRNAEIQFMAEGNASRTVKVVQAGYKKGIYVEKADEEIVIENSAKEDKRFYDLKVTSNVPFDVVIESDNEWITYKKQNLNFDYGDRPRTFTLKFNWKTNVQESERTAKIRLVPQEGDEVVLNLRQKSAPVITDDRAGDSLAVLAIYESMNGILGWDASENMMYWKGVQLWKATDKEVKAKPELLGRLKSVEFRLFQTNESLPYQVKYLKTAKSILFSGNTNTFLKSIELGPEICELAGEGKNLKELTISAYGLVKLPEGFKEFGKNLEVLDLSSNNFEYKTGKIKGYDFYTNGPGIINKENFPNLKKLSLVKINRFDTTKDLQKMNEVDTLGLRWNTGFGEGYEASDKINGDFFTTLLKMDNLEELALSLNLLEGNLPTDDELLAINGFPVYTVDDFNKDLVSEEKDKAFIDTITTAKNMYLLKGGVGAPKVWPKMKKLSLNLCFLTGKLPKWILYHPYLSFWDPFTMIFTQEVGAINTKGENIGKFENEPLNLSNYDNTGFKDEVGGSYYEVYPLRKPKYNDDDEEEGGSSTDGSSLK